MISSTVHVHTTFCDGNNSMADMAEAALEKGIQCIGFSGHSFTEHDGFGIKPEMMHDYVSEAKRLKKLYNGKCKCFVVWSLMLLPIMCLWRNNLII